MRWVGRWNARCALSCRVITDGCFTLRRLLVCLTVLSQCCRPASPPSSAIRFSSPLLTLLCSVFFGLPSLTSFIISAAVFLFHLITAHHQRAVWSAPSAVLPAAAPDPCGTRVAARRPPPAARRPALGGRVPFSAKPALHCLCVFV